MNHPTEGRPVAPTVAVVVPCFNSAAQLPATLHALLAQTHPPAEIIVVDDGSTDDSARVAEEFGTPVRVVRQPNGGAASARYRGVQAAQSDLIVFNDAGDVSRPQRLELMRAALVDHPECVAAYAVTWVRSRPEPTTARLTGKALDGAVTVLADPLARILAQAWPLAIGMNLMVRREVALRSARVDPLYVAANDYALQVQTAEQGPFAHVATVTLEYEETVGGISSRNGYLRQTAFALHAAVEAFERARRRGAVDLTGFRARLERDWPGTALHMHLRGNAAVSRRLAAAGLRHARWLTIPQRLWWALTEAQAKDQLTDRRFLSWAVSLVQRAGVRLKQP